jgi:uncharacterized protein (DUF2062 family)
MRRRWLEMGSQLWERARHEHSTPRELGWSIAVGVFAGCTPFLGLHMWIALAFATVLRLNRLWAFVGSRISFTPLFAFIAFCEIECAHRIRTRTWVPLSPQNALEHGKELLGDWLVGTVLVGGTLGATLGLAAFVAARRFGMRRALPGPRSA